MRKKMSFKWFPNAKYAWSMSNDSLRGAVTETVNILVDLLGEVVTDSSNEAEVQATTDLTRTLERYRDGYWYDEYDPSEESAELVE